MKTRLVSRWLIVLVFAVVSLALATVALAAGESPANGIPLGSSSAETCVLQTLAPGAQTWFKVAYHAGTDLELYAKSYGGASFAVYDPERITPSVGSPVGWLTPNKFEPNFLASWLGHAGTGVRSDFMYVLSTNLTSYPVTFSFCSLERELFVPPTPPEPVCAFPINQTFGQIGILSVNAFCAD